MDYKHDIFFSYKRDPQTIEWHRRVKDMLRHYVTQATGGNPIRCFMDEQSIDTGERWPESLQVALKHSRCYVGVWSPEYFQSDWCISEWRTFLEREKLTQNKTLIAPLRHNDGEFFPDEARATQWTDVQPYTSTLPAFWGTIRAVELEDQIKLFARNVSSIILAAPPFDPQWEVVEAPALPPRKIGLPRL